VQIVAASGIAAGAEVHNTYGELPNAELVHKYGFALPMGNPFDRCASTVTCADWRDHPARSRSRHPIAILHLLSVLVVCRSVLLADFKACC